MDQYTKEINSFLENYYATTKDGIYLGHQPIYGYRTPYAADSQIARFMITNSILNVLAKYKFSELIDISGAEGYTANIIRTLFNVKVKTTDLSDTVCKMAKEIFNIESSPADVHELPFADNQYEVVLCSETVEHVTFPKKAIDELIRITDKLLIITVPHDSLEFVAWNVNNKIPYGHINHFDDTSFDYLKEAGYKVEIHKTIAPFLNKVRIPIEAYNKKPYKTDIMPLSYKIYNAITPILRTIFGIKSANRIVDMDNWFVEKFKGYCGMTIVIEKSAIERRTNPKKISAKDFTSIKIPHFFIKKTSKN
jgi:ubiquinone/menaquinone biosynthesis C-methylase UbiE